MILRCQERLKFMATVSYFELLHTYNTMYSDFLAGFQMKKKKSNTSYYNIQIIPEVHRTAKTSYHFSIFSPTQHTNNT